MKKKILLALLGTVVGINAYAGKITDEITICPKLSNCRFESHHKFTKGNVLSSDFKTQSDEKEQYYIGAQAHDETIRFTSQDKPKVYTSHHAFAVYNPDKKVTKIYYIRYRLHIPGQDGIMKSHIVHVSPEESYTETMDSFMDIWWFFGNEFNIIAETFLEDIYQKPLKTVSAIGHIKTIQPR